MEYVGEETIVEGGGDDEGWVETHHFDGATSTELDDKVCEMTLDNSKVWWNEIVRFLAVRFTVFMFCSRPMI